MEAQANRRYEPTYLPTEAEIAHACVIIQQSWSDDERRRRRWGLMPGSRHANGGDVPAYGWSAPVIHVDPEIAAAIEVM